MWPQSQQFTCLLFVCRLKTAGKKGAISGLCLHHSAFPNGFLSLLSVKPLPWHICDLSISQVVCLASSFPHFWMSSISSSPCGDINHNYSKCLYKDSDPASGCLANAYQILPVSDLQIQINTATLFSLNKKHCREGSTWDLSLWCMSPVWIK